MSRIQELKVFPIPKNTIWACYKNEDGTFRKDEVLFCRSSVVFDPDVEKDDHTFSYEEFGTLKGDCRKIILWVGTSEDLDRENFLGFLSTHEIKGEWWRLLDERIPSSQEDPHA
jgi:hypothetical protein